MSILLDSIRVTPYYSQVMVEAEDASDLPEPHIGPKAALASTEAVMVSTRGDLDGDVLVEVHRGDPDSRLGAQVYDGELSFTRPLLVAGSPHSGELMTVDIGRIGWVPIKIYVDPPDRPSRVVVLLPGE
jgi:hypothetical protein